MRETQQEPASRSRPLNQTSRDGRSAHSGARHIPVNEVTHMRATIGVFRRHLWAFLTIAVLVPACAWIAIQRTTPRYTATGSLIYDPSDYKVRELQRILRTDPTTQAVMASQAEILQHQNIAQRVAERGNLYDNPEFNASLRPRSTSTRMIEWVRGLFGGNVDDTKQTTT